IMIKPDPPASLADTREAVERMDARGETIVPVDEAQVESIVRDLLESGVESLTVALINSYVNGAHEQQIGAVVERLYPGFPLALSSSRAEPASTTSSPSTWVAPRRTSPSARTASRRLVARRRSASSGSKCRRSTCTRSAPAAARSGTYRN